MSNEFSGARTVMRAKKVLAAAAGLVVGTIVAAQASPEPSFRSPAPAVGNVTPFRLETTVLAEGPLSAKWREVERAISQDVETLAACENDRNHCRPEALRFLEIVEAARNRSGLGRIGEINRSINLAIRPLSDRLQYGLDDLWASPLATLRAGAGDCEDYAIAKFVALRQVGIAEDDLKLVILSNKVTGEEHAVVAARNDGRWRLLDNRSFVMIEDSDVERDRPIFAIDSRGPKQFENPVQLAINFPASGRVAASSVQVADRVPETASDIPVTEIAGRSDLPGDFLSMHAL